MEEQINKKNKDKVVIAKQVQQEAKTEFSHSITLHRGHTLFEIRLSDTTIAPAKYDTESVVKSDWNKVSRGKAKLIKNPDCIYIAALNMENAIKKFLKRSNGSKF